MGWVVLCHGYLYMKSSGSVKNMAYTMTVQRRLISMLLPFGQFSVDTFFVSRHDIADIWVAFFQECQQYRCGQGYDRNLTIADNEFEFIGEVRFNPILIRF